MKRFAAALTALCLLALLTPGLAPGAAAAARYYITVDITNKICTVYENNNRTQSGIVRQMICTTGAPGTPTPNGTYVLPSTKTYATERTEWYYFPRYGCYAKWATRIINGYMFHSVLYTKDKVGPTRSSLNALGGTGSHGCVRLKVADAKWIALNCPGGTRVKLYHSGKTNASLRKKLLQNTFVRAEQSYEDFLSGVNGPLPLRIGSKCAEVKQLQTRLQGLGYYGGAIDSMFGAATYEAVKRFEAAAGLSQTGVASRAVWDAIFADDAPAGQYITLSQGMSGPAVKALQRTLKALKHYDGALDGVFGDSTKKAVTAYQNYANQSATGSATASQQKAMAKLARSLEELYPDGQYELAATTVEVSKARTKAKVSLYKSASSASAKLKSVSAGKSARVLKKGATWTKVRYSGATGYIPTSKLDFYTGKEVGLVYRPIGAEPTPTPEVWLPTPTPSPTPTPEVWLPENGAEDDSAQWNDTGVPGLELAEEETPPPEEEEIIVASNSIE